MTAPDRARLSPGDIVAIDTARGTRHVQIIHLHPPYPEVLRVIAQTGAVGAEEIARGPTAFVAMAELGSALGDTASAVRLVGHATIPQADRLFPTFRVPIRNRSGDIVYWWTWDGEGLAVAPDEDTSTLPIREVLPVETLRRRLAEPGSS